MVLTFLWSRPGARLSNASLVPTYAVIQEYGPGSRRARALAEIGHDGVEPVWVRSGGPRVGYNVSYRDIEDLLIERGVVTPVQ
jgi:hypothetical protein